MPSYAQWYVMETERISRDADAAFRATSCSPHYLYFKPNGLSFAVVQEDTNAPDGYELVTGERIPSSLTIEQLIMWVRRMTSRIQVLPGD
jgi:hypothetical protein